MPSVIDFYNRIKQDVDVIVDTTFFRLMEDDSGVFSGIAPITSYEDPLMLLLKVNKSKPTIASIVADEQELPSSRSRMTLTEEALIEARIGKQYLFTNKDFRMMQKMEDYLSRANAASLMSEVERYFLGIAADMVPSIVEKMTLLMMQVWTTGSCNFTDPITNQRFVLTYPNVITSGANQLMFTSNPSGSDDWGAPTTANGLAQLESHAIAFYNNFGYFPRQINLKWSLLRDLANQRSTKIAHSAKAGYGIDGANQTSVLDNMYLNDAQVEELIRDRLRGGAVQYIESMYSEESAAGVVSDVFFMDDKRYFFSEPGNCERAFVGTPERNFASGIYVAARELDDAPRKERIAGVGAGIPVVRDDRKLAARRVKV